MAVATGQSLHSGPQSPLHAVLLQVPDAQHAPLAFFETGDEQHDPTAFFETGDEQHEPAVAWESGDEQHDPFSVLETSLTPAS